MQTIIVLLLNPLYIEIVPDIYDYAILWYTSCVINATK